MKILITGGCGFLGSHIVEHLLKTTDADTQIVILDKLTYASNGFDRLRDISASLPYGLPERVQVLGCDLSQSLPEGVLRELGPVDYIIHAAAESHVDNSIVDPLPFLMSNVIGTHHLLMAARAMTGLRRIFLVSTDEVYGPAPAKGYGDFVTRGVRHLVQEASDALNMAGNAWNSLPKDIQTAFSKFKEVSGGFWLRRTHLLYSGFDEEARFRPANPYAASKAGAEAVAMAYANTYGLAITIVNTMNLIGERQHAEKFVPLVIRKVLADETVVIHADPSQTQSGSRFYLHCRTFANALAWLMDQDAAAPALALRAALPAIPTSALPLKLHVCGEREITNLDLARLIAEYVGRPLRYQLVDFHSSRPGHDLRYAMNDSLITRMGWKRPMGLEQSLEKTVRWYLAHPRWLDAGKKETR